MRKFLVIAWAVQALVLANTGRAQTATDAVYPPPTWWVALHSTGYWLETVDLADGTTTPEFNFYQGYDGSVSGLWKNRLGLRLAGRYQDAPGTYYPNAPAVEKVAYLGYAQLRLPPGALFTRLGRMFLQEGPANLTLDGLYLTMKPVRRVEVRAWGGAAAPADLGWSTQSINAAGAAGARVLVTPARTLRVGLSWAWWQQNQQVAAEPVGGEATWQPVRGLRSVLEAYYDLEQEKWARFNVLAQYQSSTRAPLWTAQYLNRRPYILATSYFRRFTGLDRIQLGRASGRWTAPNGLGGELAYFGGFIGGDATNRITASFLFPYGRAGYSGLFGFAGEENRFFGDLNWQAVTWLRLTGGVVLDTYALLEDAPSNEERDLTTLYAGANVQLREGMNLNMQIQSLENPYESEDVRFLVGLDLFAGRGASAFGLSSGRWFP